MAIYILYSKEGFRRDLHKESFVHQAFYGLIQPQKVSLSEVFKAKQTINCRIDSCPSIDMIDTERDRYVRSIRSIRYPQKRTKYRATFEGIKPNVPGFVRIGF